MRTVINKLREIVVLSLETGDIEVACNECMSICIILYFIGEPFESAIKEQLQNIELIKKLKQDFQLKLAAIWCQLFLNLSGNVKDPKQLIGEYFNEELMLSKLENEHWLVRFYFYLPKVRYLNQQ